MERLRSENPHAQPTTFLPDLADALTGRFGDGIGETILINAPIVPAGLRTGGTGIKYGSVAATR